MTHSQLTHARGGRRRRRGRALFTTAIAALVAAVVVKWAWNGAGVDLFSLPAASFGQVAAIVFAVAAALFLLRAVFAGVERRDPS